MTTTEPQEAPKAPPEPPAAVMVADLLLWCDPCSAWVTPRLEHRERPKRFGPPWWCLLCPECAGPIGGFNVDKALPARPRGRSGRRRLDP